MPIPRLVVAASLFLLAAACSKSEAPSMTNDLRAPLPAKAGGADDGIKPMQPAQPMKPVGLTPVAPARGGVPDDSVRPVSRTGTNDDGIKPVPR